MTQSLHSTKIPTERECKEALREMRDHGRELLERVLGKPRAQAAPRRRLRTLVKQTEAATGKTVTAVTMDGVKLDLGNGEHAAPENPWPLDEFRTKETKQ